jgi:hypothetical protein
MDAQRCPRCGQSFVSIRCQQCGFTGEEALFDQGCPACGYSAASGSAVREERRVSGGALPLWVYVLTILALILAAGALYFCFRP